MINMWLFRCLRFWLGLWAASLLFVGISARAAGPTPLPNDELIRQQQRERAQQEQQGKAPDVRLLAKDVAAPVELLPTAETPCFVINRITLAGPDAEVFDWALSAASANGDSPIGRCLGSAGVNLVMKRLQNAIVKHGYVTTRVLAGPQGLKTGELRLSVVSGRIRAIRFAPGTSDRARQWNAFPMTAGDLLNLRDIEQALENMKRVPTVDADIQIVPSEGEDAQPGDSDLVVSWKQSSPFRISLGADDSGAKATGRYQGNITLSADHLLTLNDLFYFTYSQDLGGQETAYGTRARTAHYSLPFGYWSLGVTASDYNYHQSVAGASQTYIYSGNSRNADVRLSRLVWRDAVSKTSLGVRGWVRASHNFIDDSEVQVQQRRMAGWELNAAEKVFLKDATLDLNLAYRWGTGALRSLPAPEEAFGEGSSRPRLTTADIQFNQPFALGQQKLRYNLVWRAQWNQTPLVPQDRFAIGGRFTVRGFDGESILSAERGWLIRNDLGINLGASGAEAYFGVDLGRVGGNSAERLVGKELSGAALGVRGSVSGMGYDLFAARPITRPEAFHTASITAGFSLNWSY